MTTTSTMDALLNAYRSHTLDRLLPTPAVVTFYPGSLEVNVQSGGDLDLCSRLGNLLVWAFTLADVTAEWWHTPDGHLHVTVLGRTSTGTRMKVYGRGPFAEGLGLVTLAREEREGVSLDELYTLLGLLREGQHEQEVA